MEILLILSQLMLAIVGWVIAIVLGINLIKKINVPEEFNDNILLLIGASCGLGYGLIGILIICLLLGQMRVGIKRKWGLEKEEYKNLIFCLWFKAGIGIVIAIALKNLFVNLILATI